MKSRFFVWICLVVAGMAFFYQLIRVPAGQSLRAEPVVWMSPDETANAVGAMVFSKKLNFELPWEFNDQFSVVHPRSFVPLAGQAVMVPIGFLGMPLILALFAKLFGLYGVLLFTPFLAMATLWALYKSLPKDWSETVKLSCLAIWLSFPTVILYSNRSAFAQLVVVCLAIWIWWLLNPLRFSFHNETSTYKVTAPWERGQGFSVGLAGFLTGLVAIIRPVELIWVLPVAVCAYIVHRTSSRELRATSYELRNCLFFVIPFLLVCLVGAIIGYKTYGQWFVSGYQVRTPVIQTTGFVAQDTEDPKDSQDSAKAVSVLDVLPFEFHPRNIWWNVKSYYGIFLWPWTLILIIALGLWIYGLAIKNRQTLNVERRTKSALDVRRLTLDVLPVVALAWTTIFVLFFYGNGLYQDYFVPNRVSLGNSFLRYTLPLSIVLSIAAGYVMAKLWKHWSLKALAVCLAVGLIAFGQWTATVRDDEGAVAVEQELVRYSRIKGMTLTLHVHMDAILSERSDKIFYPAFMAVSPMPDKQSIKQFVDTGKIIGVFIRTQDQKGLDEWSAAGLPLSYQFTSGNESLYVINNK